GGSMAKSIKSRTANTVYGIDTDKETMLFARMSGAIDGTLDENTIGESDIIFIAIRPNAAINWVKENAHLINKNTKVIDLCGVKRVVCENILPIARQFGFMFIGGHPMAGKERGGFVNSTDDLYTGASMILTPDASADLTTLEMLKDLFTDIGFAAVTFSTPEEHDRIIAFTSQLAHIVSSAYVRSPQAQKRRGFSAGSFRDMTRVARLDEDMWTELCLADSDHLVEEIGVLIKHLSQYRDALKDGDADALKALFKDGREKKATAGGN
ncbi:MAG: prephenate dehydrogenase, partial [Clostridia bacterium]|nr:prephenate dehydrogenase [Clostridia bacterium]